MSREELIGKLIEYAANAFKREAAELKESTVIKDELGTGSMQRIMMCASIENELDVVIPVVEFGQYETIGDLADKVLEEM